MALPTLDVPTYECILPTTGAKVKYRPFLVKEHKILMTLVDSDATEVARGVTELVDVCTFEKLDLKKLSHFDIEYLFLQLRSKSLGENVELVVNCPCGEKIPHTVSLNDLKIEKIEGFTNKIKLTDSVGVLLRYPNFEEVIKIFYEEADTEVIFDMVKSCVEAVYDNEEYYDRGSFTPEELDTFINSLSKSQFEKLEKFFQEMPKVVQEIEKECPVCKNVNVLKLEGLQNFFV